MKSNKHVSYSNCRLKRDDLWLSLKYRCKACAEHCPGVACTVTKASPSKVSQSSWLMRSNLVTGVSLIGPTGSTALTWYTMANSIWWPCRWIEAITYYVSHFERTTLPFHLTYNNECHSYHQWWSWGHCDSQTPSTWEWRLHRVHT